MHYVPESARELLQESSLGDASTSAAERSFHYQSAPIYLLTLVVGGLFTADLLLGMIGDPAWLAYRAPFGFRLSLIAAVLGLARILYPTLEALFEGRVGADLALTIAALAAIILGEHNTAALVVFIALCGESIEGYTVDRAQQAIRGVFNLCPAVAHVVRDEREVDVPIGELVVGDAVAIRPGERVPVDGRVSAGASAVDQSALTGETLPVDKGPGDEVFAGTLNQFGSLTVTAHKVGDQTTLAHVVRLVAEAAERKTPLERTADRLARLFLPAVLGIAAVTLIGWRLYEGNWTAGFKPALGVLVVACPCPLVLATPTAVVAAMAWLARTGVVVKGSVALERLAQIDTIAFDKTGTLTRGSPALGSIVPLAPLDESELLRLAAIAEKQSEHILGRLIVREADARGLVVPPIDDFAAHPGSGVTARVRASILGPWAERCGAVGGLDAHERTCALTVGNRRLLESQQIALPAAAEAQLAELEQAGQTTLLAAVDGEVVGIIGVRDTVRPESRAVLAELRGAGIESFALLTGDRAEPAQAVSRAVGGFDEVMVEMLPADKAAWIESRSRAGRRVAMVGDGVNDAPALAAATVGLALGGVGSDLAAEAGDLVLMGDPLRPLPGLLRLSRQLVRNIRQSIYLFAFGMNFVGMALCAGGILSPVAGAVFHEFSSLAVMINALRLLWFERWTETRLGQGTERLAAAADSLGRAFSPRQIVFRLLDNRAMIAKLILFAAALWWFASGIVTIGADERAIVTRFGRFREELSPGLHWRWPSPIERIHREQVDRVRTLQIGFRARDDRPVAGEDATAGPIEWTSEHANAGFVPMPGESHVLTGDEVPVEVAAEIHYRIGELKEFVYAAAAPAETLRVVAEAEIRHVAALWPLEGMLAGTRERIEADCLARVRRRAGEYGLGVEIVDLNLLDIHPPLAVVPAYRDVADALEEREQSVNDAQAYYAGKVLSAAGEEAIRMLSRPAGGEVETRSTAATGEITDWTLGEDQWKQLTHTAPDGRFPLSGEAGATILSAREAAAARVQEAAGGAARFESLLKTYRSNPELTGAQLYWRAIEETLSRRPLTIIDSKAGGRQHLLLIDPSEIGAFPALGQPAPSPGPAANGEPGAPGSNPSPPHSEDQ